MILATFFCCAICLALVLGTYIAYPFSLYALFPLRRKRLTGKQTPDVTLVISAYNEQSVIGDKIENALALAYPREKIEIMVISDASADATDAIVESYQEKGALLCRQEDRLGKSAGLSQFVPTARGEIIVFSDANSLYEPDAIGQLVRHFADPNVGYVVGSQKYVSEKAAASVSESFYWKYESWIKKLESQVGSVVGGDGAIYAIRARLFEPLKADDISDFTLPLRIVARGYRGVYEEQAVCYERTAADFRGEFYRKARIVNRSLGAVVRVPQALNPFKVGLFAYQLFLHKIVRWLVPFLLVLLLAGSVGLAFQGWIALQILTGCQLAFYLLAALWPISIFGPGLLGRKQPRIGRLKPVYIAFYFCMVNLASALGVVMLLRGRRISMWTPQRRESHGSASGQPPNQTDKIDHARRQLDCHH